jgi:hypothetical protein
MFARLTLPALALTTLALTLATPLLAETKATITGGPAATCAQPGMSQDGKTALPLCSTTDTAQPAGEAGDDDESEGGED